MNMEKTTHTTDNTMDTPIYRKALIRAFVLESLFDNVQLSYDSIYEHLKSSNMFGDFLDSVEFLSHMFRCEVVRWTYKDFEKHVINNNNVIKMLCNCFIDCQPYINMTILSTSDSENEEMDIL